MRNEVRGREGQNFEMKKRERSKRDMECGGMELKRERKRRLRKRDRNGGKESMRERENGEREGVVRRKERN